MNHLILLITGFVCTSMALAAIGILNQVYAQDNSTAIGVNVTKGNATMPIGNGTPDLGKVTPEVPDDAVGHISRRSR